MFLLRCCDNGENFYTLPVERGGHDIHSLGNAMQRRGEGESGGMIDG